MTETSKAGDVLLLLVKQWCLCVLIYYKYFLHYVRCLMQLYVALQLNTEWGADANRKVDYLGIDAVGLTVYVLCCNAQWIS